MSDARFNRLEDKVDAIDDKVEKINLGLTEMKYEFKIQNDLVREHVAGDAKIITHLEPLIPQLKKMAEDYTYNQQKKKENSKAIKKYGMYFGITSAFFSVIGAVVKFFNLL